MSARLWQLGVAVKHHQEMMSALLAPPQLLFASLPSLPHDSGSSFDTLLHTQLQYTSPVPPPPTHRPNIASLDDATALFRFRFTISELEDLVAAHSLPPTHTIHRVTVSSLVALAMLLRRLAYPFRLADFVLKFGYDYTSLSLVINAVCTQLATRFYAHMLIWPGLTHARVRMYERAVREYTQRSGVTVRSIRAFINGAFRCTARPNILSLAQARHRLNPDWTQYCAFGLLALLLQQSMTLYAVATVEPTTVPMVST